MSALRASEVLIKHDRGLTAPAEAMSAHSGLNRCLQIIYTLYFLYSKSLTALPSLHNIQIPVVKILCLKKNNASNHKHFAAFVISCPIK